MTTENLEIPAYIRGAGKTPVCWKLTTDTVDRLRRVAYWHGKIYGGQTTISGMAETCITHGLDRMEETLRALGATFSTAGDAPQEPMTPAQEQDDAINGRR